jgi:hypothetical protein
VIFFEATRRQADKSPGRDPVLAQASREFIGPKRAGSPAEPGSAGRSDPSDSSDAVGPD